MYVFFLQDENEVERPEEENARLVKFLVDTQQRLCGTVVLSTDCQILFGYNHCLNDWKTLESFIVYYYFRMYS